jgi:hypothetical protein
MPSHCRDVAILPSRRRLRSTVLATRFADLSALPVSLTLPRPHQLAVGTALAPSAMDAPLLLGGGPSVASP